MPLEYYEKNGNKLKQQLANASPLKPITRAEQNDMIKDAHKLMNPSVATLNSEYGALLGFGSGIMPSFGEPTM
jgi:hypothetical protein